MNSSLKQAIGKIKQQTQNSFVGGQSLTAMAIAFLESPSHNFRHG